METIEIYKDYFNRIADLSDESNPFHKYNKWISENLELIEINDLSELLMNESISHYMELHDVEIQNECYCNAARLTTAFINDVTYCEGYFLLDNFPIPFDHAWIKYNGKYYDTTIKNKFARKYAIVREFTSNEVLDFQIELMRFGPYTPEYFNKKFNTKLR